MKRKMRIFDDLTITNVDIISGDIDSILICPDNNWRSEAIVHNQDIDVFCCGRGRGGSCGDGLVTTK